MKRVVAAALTALAFTTESQAAEGRWTAGFGQGVTEANVSTRSGVTFSVVCPLTSPTARTGFSLDVPRLRGGRDSSVATILSVDGRHFYYIFSRRILDQGQVALTFGLAPDTAHTQMEAILSRLRRGRYLIVRIPSERIHETFPLRGAREALADCPGGADR